MLLGYTIFSHRLRNFIVYRPVPSVKRLFTCCKLTLENASHSSLRYVTLFWANAIVVVTIRLTMSHQADAKRLFDSRGYTGATIHDQNPVHLLEKPVRDRIIESYYWKEQCFAVNEATLCDRAANLTFIGGTYGQQKPTPFLCLAMKLLQLMPERDIILEYLRQEEFKYLTALAAFYIRLTFDAKEVYEVLEPLLGDWRKLRRRTRDGGYALSYIDQFVDDLLTKDRVCGTSLRKLPQRTVLEDLGVLEVRESPLGDELDGLDDEEDEVVEVEAQLNGAEEEAQSSPERNQNGAEHIDSDG